MKSDINNNDNRVEDESAKLFSIIQVPWKKSKEVIWEDFSKRMVKRPTIEMKPKFFRWQIAAAAILIFSVSFSIFIRTYTINHKALVGTHLRAELPGGSIVNLNSGSEISYNPFWWWVERSVKFKGEAFFDVKKGEKFSVMSTVGTTEVLGTSFNIFSRKQRYEVTCVTGKVKVLANTTQQSVIIYPAQKASLQKRGQLKIEENVNTVNAQAWILNRLVFTSVPIIEVFEEIERQYDVDIVVLKGFSKLYTGSFEKDESVDELLLLICRPFELKVVKKSSKKFIINK